MLIRIVKLSISPDKISSFERFFKAQQQNILNFKGCIKVELWQDNADNTLFFTYSLWDSEACLESYRQSKFFKSIWPKTKLHFNAPAQVYSMHKIQEV